MDIFYKAKNMEMVNINFFTVSYMKVNLQITKLMEKVIYIMRNKIINIQANSNLEINLAEVNR